MHLLKAITVLAGVASAAPVVSRGVSTTAADIILAIMPKSASCADTTECRTNVQAAPFLIDAMKQYKVFNAAQIAGVLALIAFESVEMRYKHNVSPGRPGQGTSNMQMINFNRMYADSIPAVKAKVTASTSDNDVLALLEDDQYNFGSGPWFLTTQCKPDVMTQLTTATDAGFKAYMACVGIPDVPQERLDYWHAALKAFGYPAPTS
jgi:hypothetical protein